MSKNLALGGLIAGILLCGVSLGMMASNRYQMQQKMGLSVMGLVALLGGYFASQRAIDEQLAFEKYTADLEAKQRLIEEASQPVMLEEIAENARTSAEYRRQLHALDAGAAFSHIARENHPGWVEAQLAGAGDEDEEVEEVGGVDRDESAIAGNDKLAIEASDKPKIEGENMTSQYINGFIKSTCLIWGNQGAGKSWFVRYLVQEKLKLGYRVIVFDPNSNKREWEGVELYNTYAEIERMMRWYVNEVQTRYEEFGQSTMTEAEWRDRLWTDGKALSIICEEATTYADFIKDEKLLETFFKCGGTLSRKQEAPICGVAHNNTQYCFGNIKNLANLLRRLQQIQLLGTTDPKTQQPIASGRALVRMDSSEEWIEVQVPWIEEKITSFSQVKTQKVDRTYLEKVWGMEFDLKKPEPIEPMLNQASEPLNQPTGNKSGNSEPTYTPLLLNQEQALKLITSLRTELNQTQIIEQLWGCKKGGAEGWKLARNEFKKLTGE